MENISDIFRRLWKYTCFLLAFYVLGWGFTSYKTVFLGLIFGTSLSLFNMYLLKTRVEKMTQAVIQGGKVRSLGTTARMATAILAVMIAVKFPNTFHLISVIIGLMTSYFVIIIDFFIQSLLSHKNNTEKK